LAGAFSSQAAPAFFIAALAAKLVLIKFGIFALAGR
jgi:hypothetical protein